MRATGAMNDTVGTFTTCTTSLIQASGLCGLETSVFAYSTGLLRLWPRITATSLRTFSQHCHMNGGTHHISYRKLGQILNQIEIAIQGLHTMRYYTFLYDNMVERYVVEQHADPLQNHHGLR